MYSDIQRRIIETLDEMQYTPPTLQFNNDNTDSYECFTCPGGEKPPKEEFEAKLKELIDAQPIKELRQERNKRLTECDWVVIRATSTDTPIPEEWKVYMQTLRDLPSTTEDPANPVWPTAPTS
jgi:hypothetical protein